MSSLVPTLLALLGLAGCAYSGAPTPTGTGKGAEMSTREGVARLGELPASFTGQIPCADCPGIIFRLNLFPDQSFFQSMTYQERDFTSYDIGRWHHRRGEPGVIELVGEGERPTLIGVVDSESVRLLDAEGRVIRSGLNYTLRRTPEFELIEPRLTLSGMYQYMADAALFTECRTGRRFPVSMEADNISLERGYLAVRKEPAEEVLVTLEATIAMRPAMEGDAMALSIVPERFISASPGESCESVTAGSELGAVPLEGTTWKLVVLDDRAVSSSFEGRAPSLTLDPNELRASGAAGCNLFGGSYTVSDNEIRLSQLISTKMYCEGAMDQERAYFDILEAARLWRVQGRWLYIYDAAGEPLATYEAEGAR